MSFALRESGPYLNHQKHLAVRPRPQQQWQTDLAVQSQAKHWANVEEQYVPYSINSTSPKFHFAARLHVIYLCQTNSQNPPTKHTLRPQTVTRRPPAGLFSCTYSSREPVGAAAHSRPMRPSQSDEKKSREGSAMA